jgi:hypothetical protein
LHLQLIHWNLFFDPCWTTHKNLQFLSCANMNPFVWQWNNAPIPSTLRFLHFFVEIQLFSIRGLQTFPQGNVKKKILCFCTLLSYKLPSSSLLCKEPCRLLCNYFDIHYGWKIMEQFMPQGQKWMMDEIHTFWMKRLIWINFIHAIYIKRNANLEKPSTNS